MLYRKIIFAFLSILIIVSTGCDDLLTIDATDDSGALTLAKKMRGIWIVGGTSTVAGSTMLSELDLYDPVTNTWYPNVAANALGGYSPTSFSMVASVAGKIYVIGGASTAGAADSAVFEYNIATNTWRTMTNLTYNCMDALVYTQNDKIYIMGGTTTTVATNVITTNSVFDPAGGGGLGSWTTTLTVLPAPGARTGMGGGNINGIVSFAGGRINTGAAQTVNDIYVVDANTYTVGTEFALPTARHGMASTWHTSKKGTFVFFIGGSTGTTPAVNYFSLTAIAFVTQATSLYVYTPPSSTTYGWFTGTYHPYCTSATNGIIFAAAAVSPYNGSTSTNNTLYVFGGLRDTPLASMTVSNSVHATSAEGTTILPAADYVHGSWSTKTSMPRARYGHRAVVIQQ